MNINLIRFKNSYFSKKDLEEDNRFIEEINDVLFDNDYFLKEDVTDPILNVLLVESDHIDKEFKSYDFSLINPLIILVGKHETALKGALELNSYLILQDYNPLIVSGKEASLILELAKVMNLKTKLKGTRLGLFGTFKEDDKNKLDGLDKKLDVKVEKFSRKKFYDIYLESEPLDIPHLDQIKKIIKDKDELDDIKKLYHTVKYFITNYNLSALAFDIKEFNIPLRVVASLYNEQGYSFIVENDLTSLLSLHVLNSISETNAFFAHFMKLEFNKSKITLLIQNPPLNIINNEQGLLKSNVTLTKFSLNHRHLYTFNAKIIDSHPFDDHSYLVSVEVEGRELFTIYNEPIGGTIAFSYGDYLGNLIAFDNILFMNEQKD